VTGTQTRGHGAPIDPMELRRALGCFVTGVTVVATRDADGRPRGFTANSFQSVSLDPPLILVCIDRRAASFAVFERCDAFAVNILGEDQQTVSGLFASKAPDKFERAAWRPAASGAPLLDGCVAWLDCAPHQRVDAGDHVVMIGRVRDLAWTPRMPLGYCRGNYLRFGLEQRAVMHRLDRRVQVGCILDRDGRVLLVRDPARGPGAWTLPVAESAASGATDPATLEGLLRALGLDAELGFLFSVFEGPEAGRMSVYYRGELRADPPARNAASALFAHEDIPWPSLPSDAMRTMLRRYVAERAELRFGVYVGSSDGGTVAFSGASPQGTGGA